MSSWSDEVQSIAADMWRVTERHRLGHLFSPGS